MKKFLALILLVLFSCQKEPIIYNLTTSTNPNDGGKIIPGSQEYEEGESVTLIASPFDEYVFDSWTGAEGTSSTTTITMDSNKSVVANFIKKKYTLTLNVEGEGEVSKSVVKAGITESSDHNSGTVLSLSAIPAEEWEFSHWTGDLTGKDNPKEITIDKAKTVTAVFIKKKYPLTVEVEGQGSVAEKVIKAGLATDYNSGTIVELTATAETGWEFKEWIGDLTGNDNPSQITIDESKKVRAVFKLIEYKLTVDIDGLGDVEVLRLQDRDSLIYNLTAIPDQYNAFIRWEGDLTGAENPTEIYLDKDKTVKAIFENQPFYLDDNGVTVKARDWAEIGEKGTINGVEYTLIDEATLRQMVADNKDVTKVVTTKVTNMSKLFEGKLSFNQNIKSWDTSNVTTMQGMFAYNGDDGMAFNQDISNWDVSNVTDMSSMFVRARNFNQNIGSWNVSNVTDMSGMFLQAWKFNQDISNWDVSKVTTMNTMFQGASVFNQKIGKWDLASVTDLRAMFNGSREFNQDIGDWNTSKVTAMSRMFQNAVNFNQDIGSWNTSSVTDMEFMFNGASSFNQPLNNWDVSNVTKMNQMFWYAENFNQDLNNWDVSSVTTMNGMFDKAYAFNGNVSSWNVLNVIDMWAMFAYSSFNQDISEWNVSNVTDMASMFNSNGDYNQPLDDWDVSNVTRMAGMFARSPFNQDLSKWDVSSVTDMEVMFEYNDVFNQDISDWNVSNVTNMKAMFLDADAFNQDIGSWDVSSVTNMDGMFHAANVFNQDLSSWCVSKIDSEPEKFSLGSSLTDSNKPVWGICNATDLVAWYPFNGNANDESGNDKNGEVSGATLATDRFGNEKSAYHFSSNQDIIIPETENYGNVFPLTVSLWYKVDKLIEGEVSNVFSKYRSSSWNGYQILHGDFSNVPNGSERENNGFGVTPWYVNGENRIIGYYRNTPFIQEFIEKEVWYHYVFVAAESGGKIYVNGELIDSQDWNGTPTIINNSYKWKIGGNYEPGKPEWGFNGKIDDIAIWKRALTDDEIKAMYSN